MLVLNTLADLKTLEDPGFLVDVIIRHNGNLFQVFTYAYHEEAVSLAEEYLKLGFTVEMEESDGEASEGDDYP